ncbi:STAS domain-containing protein [Streptomyces sp. cmx-4-9]|uniref:STAS domain-containing protein n=1 Tax=Streptomyces sp. cmx-4-9 TaxID=2790941 RepID=UPI003980A349
MTSPPPPPLLLTPFPPDANDLRIALEGDLDHTTCALLSALVDRQLAAHPGLRNLRLDCTRLLVCDSMGLSALLMVRRRTSAAGVRLYLDGRQAALERLLIRTGTLEHLTGPPATDIHRSRLGSEGR